MEELIIFKNEIKEYNFEKLINKLEIYSRQSDYNGKNQRFIEENSGKILLLKLEIMERYNNK